VIYSHEEVGKGFEGATKIVVGNFSIPLVVGTRSLLCCKVGSKCLEGLALEHRSSLYIQEALKETDNTCEDDVGKLNLSSSCSFPLTIYLRVSKG
jgi:hypothetical protein